MFRYIGVAGALAFLLQADGQMTSGQQLLHTHTSFRFTVDLPYSETFPLFGAWRERDWAPDWHPEFIYPIPAEDIEGAVFRVTHGMHSSIWTLTRFDAIAGHVQYAVVMNSAVATRIDIDVKRRVKDKTDITVAYEWTALDTDANENVKAIAKRYESAGAEWAEQIRAYATERGIPR